MMHRRSGEDRRGENLAGENEKRVVERRELLADPDLTVGRLRTIPMFADLSAEQFMKIIRICSKRKYARGEHIFRAGDAPEEMFILIQGKMQATFSDGLTLEEHGPTGMVGELGVITGEPRDVTITAVTDCIALTMHRAELFNLFRNNGELWTKILTNIIRDLARKRKIDAASLERLRRRRFFESI